MSNKKSVTDAVDKAEHRRHSKKLKQRLNITSGQRLFIFLSAIAITLISFLYAGLYNDKHGGKAAPGSLTVSIDQKTGTPDANPSYTSVFTVQFNEAIDESTFTNTDITLAGTAPGQQVQSITEAGTFNKTTYEVRIQATGAGTITPTIAQEVITAQNIASGTNQVSTSTDNSVTYNGDWAPGEFVTTWKTDNPGVSGPNQITIPTTGGGYNYNVDWGDGNTSTGLTGNSTHTYASTGTYTVSITGTFPRIAFNNGGDRQKILTVEQWSTNAWASMEYAFMGCANLSVAAIDAPDFSLLTSLDTMFANSTNLNSNLNHWDVSHITSIHSVFNGASSFNQPLNSWDVSNVTDMNSMFYGASAFDQPLNNWDVGNVTSMWASFYNATSFNQPLDNWDVGNVTSMSVMFSGASSFNQPLNNWNTGSVTSIGGIFTGASAFNQPLNNWNTGNVTYMGNAFKNATSFNQPLNNWDVSHVTNTDSMFSGASSFNQPLNNWNTGNITFMYGMFKNTSSFNQSLAAWDVSNVTGTTGMYDMLNYTALSVANYDATLIGWSSQNLKNGVHLNAFSRKYCTSAAERQSIITNHSWTITDGGQDCASTRAPQVDTNSATSITQNSTTLNGVTSPDTITDRGFQYGPTNSYGSIATDSSATITTYGSQGSGNGQFGFAYGVATDSSGNVYVADSANHRIQKFDANGNFLMKFGTNGSGNGQLNAPDDISIDSSSNIYVADSLNHRIQKFDSNGTYLSQFGTNGSGNGQFNTPASITFDTSGNIYVADQDNHRIQKFDSNGTYLSQFGTNGSGNGQFANPHGVTVDTSGNIYVADTNNHRIQKFDSSGSYVAKWGSAGSGNGQFSHPSNTAIDKDGNVYVMDFFNHRVQKFSNNGFYISQFGSGGSGLTEFTFPHDLAFSPNGNLYTQDNLGYRLKRYVGTITANISGLTCGTSYHYRAYATNSYGTGYGDDQTFTTSACPQDPFIMRVKTDNPGTSNNNQYIISTNTHDYSYNYNVDCNNDGSVEHSNQTGNVTCTYGSADEYDVAITGSFPHMPLGIVDQQKIIDVKQWGDNQWQDMSNMFYGAKNLITISATDIPNLNQVTSMHNMFFGATSFNTNINNWDVSHVTDMSFMFNQAESFNQPLDNWDVSSVVNMMGMFGVEHLDEYETSFNQPLNDWDVSNVLNMSLMFAGNSAFNQPLNDWDVSNVTDMSQMFMRSDSFDQPLNNWDTSSLDSAFMMFAFATSFNQPLSNWDVSGITEFDGMFANATEFDQSLASWDVSNAVAMPYMFGDFIMAYRSMYEQYLGKTYNQWTQPEKDNFYNIVSILAGFAVTESYTPNPSGLSTSNYDATLIAWSAQNIEQNVPFDAGKSKYCDAEVQRQSIIDNFTWTINDAGKECPATAPSAPLSPSITEVTTSSMKFNWQPPSSDGGSAITSYQVQYKASSSGTWINAPVQGPSPTSHVLTNLNPSTSYDFRVAAINAVGSSPYTNPVSATTLTPSTPSPSPSPSVTPDPTPSPTTTVTPTPDPEVPTTDTRTNTPVPGTPVYKPKPSATPAPQQASINSGSFTEKLRGYIGAVGPSASYAPASLLILLVALAIFYLYQTWREQQVYNHLDKLLRRYRVSKQLRADFVNLSSHYLNTPLQIMRGSLELAQTALPHMAHEIKVIGASLEIMSHDTANLLQANQDSTEASASLVQLDKQDLPHLMRRTGVWLPVVSTVALMLIFEIVILVVGRMGLNPYTVGVFICLTIFAGLMVLFTYRARWRLRSLNKQAQATLSFERNIDSQRVSFMETTTKELNDQIDAMRLPAEKLLATGQVPTFANGYAMLGQVAAKLSQITTVGQVSAETALTPLKPWLESHLPVMTEYVESQGMKFNSKIEPNLAVNLTREALAQIVSSLIGNAVKFSKAGAEIGLTIVAQGDMIHLAVQDTGVGIAKDKLAQLMQPFARGTDVLAYDYEGIGLSLYLDRLIVERVGGELTMQSVVGKGTTVSLLLPRAGK